MDVLRSTRPQDKYQMCEGGKEQPVEKAYLVIYILVNYLKFIAVDAFHEYG
jgi:hypothetical protein